MSSTEIYAFDKEGNSYLYDEVHNANLGHMAIWRILEKKYLPSLLNPAWLQLYSTNDYCSRLFPTMCNDKTDYTQEIWDLAEKDSQLTKDERIVLLTTFDKCVVKRESLPDVIRAYESFEGRTNLKEQAAVLKEAYADPDIIAVAFSYSLIDGLTLRGVSDPLNPGSRLSYNLFSQSEHWYLDEAEELN